MFELEYRRLSARSVSAIRCVGSVMLVFERNKPDVWSVSNHRKSLADNL